MGEAEWVQYPAASIWSYLNPSRVPSRPQYSGHYPDVDMLALRAALQHACGVCRPEWGTPCPGHQLKEFTRT